MVEPAALKGEFGEALAQAAGGGAAHPNVVQRRGILGRRLHPLVSRAQHRPLKAFVQERAAAPDDIDVPQVPPLVQRPAQIAGTGRGESSKLAVSSE